MSVDTKSEDTKQEQPKAATEPADDATVIHDEISEEKSNDELVSSVAKMLNRDDTGEPIAESTEAPASDKPGEKEPPKAEEPEGETPALSDDLHARAESAGLSKELAERLHQTGHLEETLAAFDRTLIERFQSHETEDTTEETPDRRETPPKDVSPKEPESKEDVPDLDPDIYDEELVKRDAYHKQRIDALEAHVKELVQERQSAFDRKFDGMVDELGHDDLFGKGRTVPKDKQTNRDKLYRAYEAVCQMHDVDPNDCDPQWGERALAAMFPEDVFKQAQRQTVDRLRDAEGKFLSSSAPKGAPPAKDATPEEAHGQLVSNVASYLKKKGVEMSGV